MKKNPGSINQKRLIKLFKDIKRVKSDENRFCFLIGAGASKSSGIKTGEELSSEWYEDLKVDLDEEELKKWKKKIKFDENNIGAFYPHLYQKRYEASPQAGYEEFEKLMEDVEPGIGYVILSQILTTEKHNFVITTNFDFLIEDSVRMYTYKKPFVAGHETLAEFISSQTERPTIIKVHRDLFLHPFNDDGRTKKLKDEWKNALLPILKNFNLLVIGYGGNDGSLMDYLSSIEAQDRKAIYWCVRNEKELSHKIKNLLDKKDFVVRIDGFDELMICLYNALDYKVFENSEKPENHPFVLAAKKRITNLNVKLQEYLDRLPKDKVEIPKGTKGLYSGAMKFVFDVNMEKDENKKDEIYRKGLAKYPDNAFLLGGYAIFLKNIRKDYDKAEEYYKKAIELDPKRATNIGNYALFLQNIRKDYDKASEYYKRALELDPKHANNIGNYAVFLSDILKDYDKAEEYFKKAIELDPKRATHIGNYANFLSNILKDYDKAEEYYKRALELDPKHATNIGNYALFLQNIRKDYDKASEYYKRAIEIDPNSAGNIGNYAVFLSNIRKDYDKAEEYYKKAIELDPKYADNIGNYAIFLSSIRKDYDKAEEYYKKAIELDPNSANNIGNYANFLSNILKDYDKASEYYKRALELDPNSANNNGNYAHLLLISKQDYTTAENYINRAFELGADMNLALLSELWFYRYAHYEKWFEKGKKELERLTSSGAKSIGWNLDSHIEIAKSNNHPDIQKLQEFSNLITK